MATETLQSFNVFLTERLTAAASDIYCFVEKTITDYQEELYRTNLENQRLQRLLDLVFKPEIRLHRADSKQINVPTATQEVCVEEQKLQRDYVPRAVKMETEDLSYETETKEPCSMSVETLHSACGGVKDAPSKTISDEEYEENQLPDSPYIVCWENDDCEAPQMVIQVPAAGEQTEDKKPLPSSGASPPQSQTICHSTTQSNEKPFPCPICGHRFTKKGHIKEHLRTHTGEKPYRCYICGKCFSRSTNMAQHVWLRHREKLPFKCTQCSKCLPLLTSLKHHMKVVHNTTFSL